MTPLLAQASAPAPADSLAGFVPPSPLPDPVAGIFRYFFNVPQWIQIGGFFLGLAVATWLIALVVRRRHSIIAWLRSRSRPLRWGLGITTAVIAGAAAWSGERTWNYMQHDNDFCTSCHVMETPFQRFTTSAHHELSCHDCHQQSIFASGRQMVLWVAQRPEDISDHAPVPNARCEECHVTGEPDTWRRIRETAGHRIHLESNDPALAGVQCVTCHGVEVHRFTPVDATCGTTGCHAGTSIQLAKMSNQTSLHCIVCHRFTAEVGAGADSATAAHAIGPRLEQCNGCHQMQAMIADFDPARDPHGAECGTCHNPHVQTQAKDAGLQCATCHADWRNQPFHVGPAHAKSSESCTLCHKPHQARVDASDCTGCHRDIASRAGVDPGIARRLRAALPLEIGSGVPAAGDPVVASTSPPGETPTPGGSFSHAKHASLPCLRCHDPGATHGVVSFTMPAGCKECHHGSTAAMAGCAACHTSIELAQPIDVAVQVQVQSHPPRVSNAKFDHSIHAAMECGDCHDATAARAPLAGAVGCADCHADHHVADRSCGTCHSGAYVKGAHAQQRDAHVACGTCHDSATIAALTPDRGFCLTCHTAQSAHYATSDPACTSCHFLSEPEQFRAQLTSPQP